MTFRQRRFFRNLCGLSFALFCALACAPEGELQRTLHPPSKRLAASEAEPEKNSERVGEKDKATEAQASTNSANLAEGAIAKDAPGQLKGLPEACSIDSLKQLCIHCQSEQWAVERCYEFKGEFEPKEACQHTTDHVKCLSKSPPFAFNLDWRSSHEKFLRENFLLWRETVHQIWDDKLLSADIEESERLLKALDWLTLTLSTKKSIESTDGETLVKYLGLELGASKLGQDLLLSMQKSRVEGKLSLSLLLDRLGEFYIRTHGTSSLWDELSTMSLEGLED